MSGTETRAHTGAKQQGRELLGLERTIRFRRTEGGWMSVWSARTLPIG